MARAYGVVTDKRAVPFRWTFYIGKDGKILKVDRKVKAAVDGATVELYPYMDMGGGDGHSTPHSGPEALDGGRYGWDVNFIMSGGWEMTVTLSPPGEVDRVATFIGYTVYEPDVEA